MPKLGQLLGALVGLALLAPVAQATLHTRNVVLVVCDGLRWQEVFTGADRELVDDAEAGGSWAPREELRERFWRDDVAERRRALLPFLWGTIAQDGELFGNRAQGSEVNATNGVLLSYPGYNEMLSGSADPRITSNEFGPNPNLTVFEWLDRQPGFHGRVDVFGTWSVFADIFNVGRSHLPVRAGTTVVATSDRSPRGRLFRELYESTTPIESTNPYDAFLHVALRDHLRQHRPRVLFVGYGDSDLWAHLGRYDLVLESAHSFDRFVGELWRQLQGLPEYRGTTTLIITADHGRGRGAIDWREHGATHPGSSELWIAVLGPDTPPRGERRDLPPISEGQIAATVAAFLGADFGTAGPSVAPPIAPAFRDGTRSR